MLTQIIIFGASGDLTGRKLIPGLLASHCEGRFDGPIQIVGVARRAKSDDGWRAELTEWLEPADRARFATLAPHVFYQAGDALDPDSAAALAVRLDGLARQAGADPAAVGRLFYLALKPDLFAPVVDGLAAQGLLHAPLGEKTAWRRVVVEKPFGTDLASAQALNRALRAHLHEEQILRIDHYLGK
ncbi:MAG: glucose-6-phosphate dehydrogenase, partial [Myxococcales bacterium]|nr:glucose-6-phosphate dehydrogenase [Myxococcales bacterium]